ncbi:MAG: Beta-lysine N6-acetyltransferase [Euryarchaeota archaeon ADurb.BinA087]|nr:MAG: Beta-lysine N6-acetyltransferase [Euryarchaeota archaeon ADurb.BinA087]HPX72645.1 putative beta-lysine N-acetyltransferase [Methanoregulaceae archaeon]
MAADAILQIGKSIVQHGPLNHRVYVVRLSPEDIPGIIHTLDALAEEEGYSKICVKVPESAGDIFIKAGYQVEAVVPCFYYGRETAFFMAKYPDPQRRIVTDPQTIADVVSIASGYRRNDYTPLVLPGFSLMPAHPSDAGEMAALFRSVFETYPFPTYDPDFITASMKEGVRYFCIRQSGQIVAAASCEVNTDAKNVEMTDFATDPGFRGKGLAGTLLYAMEAEMKKEEFRLAYTIARAKSYSINITFARGGYEYGGLLPNNTNISGTIEDMNVWYKRLPG